MSNPRLQAIYLATTKNAWNSNIPNFMLSEWGYNDGNGDPIHPTWKQAMTHVFNNGYSVAGPVRWKEGNETDGTQCIFKIQWMPPITFIIDLLNFVEDNPTKAAGFNYAKAKLFLINQGWDVDINDL